jgi:hypothetical protein
MATFVGIVGWFLIVCGVVVFVVPLVIHVPDPDAGRWAWGPVRDGATLIGLGLLTLYFPLEVHVWVFLAMGIAGWFIRGARIRAGNTG